MFLTNFYILRFVLFQYAYNTQANVMPQRKQKLITSYKSYILQKLYKCNFIKTKKKLNLWYKVRHLIAYKTNKPSKADQK